MFLRLLYPDPDTLVRGTDPDLLSLGKNSKKNLDFDFFVTSLCLFIFKERCKCTSVPHPDPFVYWLSGSASGSVSQRNGSEDPDSHPDPAAFSTK
jgi:hypothetical protein